VSLYLDYLSTSEGNRWKCVIYAYTAAKEGRGGGHGGVAAMCTLREPPK
jgi:hypothetical protein